VRETLAMIPDVPEPVVTTLPGVANIGGPTRTHSRLHAGDDAASALASLGQHGAGEISQLASSMLI